MGEDHTTSMLIVSIFHVLICLGAGVLIEQSTLHATVVKVTLSTAFYSFADIILIEAPNGFGKIDSHK